MDLGEPILVPSIDLPEPYHLPTPILELPKADLPSFKPMVVPPNDLATPPKAPAKESPETQRVTPQAVPQIPVPEVQNFRVPFTEVDVPMPTNEIMVAAGTTAVISVAATLTATSAFKWIVTISKPVLKQMWTRLTKKKAKLDSSSS